MVHGNTSLVVTLFHNPMSRIVAIEVPDVDRCSNIFLRRSKPQRNFILRSISSSVGCDESICSSSSPLVSGGLIFLLYKNNLNNFFYKIVVFEQQLSGIGKQVQVFWKACFYQVCTFASHKSSLRGQVAVFCLGVLARN